MKFVRGFSILVLLVVSTQLVLAATHVPQPATSAAVKSFGQLPLFFEPNRGQTDAQARFVARGQGYSLFLTPSEAVLSLRSLPKEDALHRAIPDEKATSSVLRLRLLQANDATKISGRNLLPGYSNYFIGQDPTKWRTRIPQYGKVEYSEVYPGINLLYYGNQRQLEYDFVVAPGADPKAIAFQLRGGDKVELNEQGDVVIGVHKATVQLHKPVAYQQVNGVRREIAGNYVVAADGRISFEVGAYDSTLPLVIDPVLSYSSYLGGTAIDSANAITNDDLGNAYVTGVTTSTDFPTLGAFQGTNNGTNAFLTKMSPDGGSVIFSTYLGGTDITCNGDRGNAISVSNAEHGYEPFIAGRAFSTDFPVTTKAYQKTGGGCTAGVGGSGFVTRFSGDGTVLKFSTYFGGLGGKPTEILGIFVSPASNNAYVTGMDATGTLATTGAFQTTLDPLGDTGAFVTKFSTDGAHLIFSTYVRAKTAGIVIGNSNTVDRNNNSYITGEAQTDNFPVTNGGFQKTFAGGVSDAFVTKVNTTGNKLVYSTYMGGSDPTTREWGSQIVVEFTFGAYVVGTTSSPDFPTTIGTVQPTYPGGASSAYVARVASDGTRLNFSTFLGGSQGSSGVGIGFNPVFNPTSQKWESCHAPCNLVVFGNTTSTDFPMLNPMQPSGDMFLTVLDGFATSISGYSTLLGSASGDTARGLAVDSKLQAYITGFTSSTSYPTTPTSLEPNYAGGFSDGFVSKVAMSTDLAVSQVASPNPVPQGQNLTFTITVTNNGIDNGVNVQLSDTVPAGTAFVSVTPSAGTCNPPPGQTGTARCMLPVMSSAPGQNTWTITFVVTATGTPGQIIHNTPNVIALGPDPNTANNKQTTNVRIQ
jgi:uncharacterized repeat protein (TIGR01451 family)